MPLLPLLSRLWTRTQGVVSGSASKEIVAMRRRVHQLCELGRCNAMLGGSTSRARVVVDGVVPPSAHTKEPSSKASQI